MMARRIGRYEIQHLLGEGGAGRVYAAFDTLLNRQVAIKVLRAEASRNREFVTRFLNEAKSFGDLRHPNIATLYDLELGGKQPHMVMELVEGQTLEDVLEWGRMPSRQCLAVIAQAAAGLAAAHHKGVIHRDIKPGNLMITENGLLKIMDFGIARVQGSQRLTRTNQVFATLLYASPEQLRGDEVDARSDVYSLGVVAYEMLAGRPPFVAATDAELRAAQLELRPADLRPLVKGLNSRIEAGIMRALAKRPRDRFDTVEAFSEAVGASAIRADSVDILGEYLSPMLQRLSASNRPTPTNASRPDAVGPTHLKPGRSNRQRNISSVSREPNARPDASLWPPIATLGTAVFVFVLGFGYILWSVTKIPSSPRPLSQIPSISRERQVVAPIAPRPRLSSQTPEAAQLSARQSSQSPLSSGAPLPNPSPFTGEVDKPPYPASPVLTEPPVAPIAGPILPREPAAKPSDSLLGTWTGVWNNSSRLTGSLIIREITESGEVDADYLYGWGGTLKYRKHLTGSLVDNNTIIFPDDEGATFRFILVGDTLEATFSNKRTVLIARFTRM